MIFGFGGLGATGVGGGGMLTAGYGLMDGALQVGGRTGYVVVAEEVSGFGFSTRASVGHIPLDATARYRFLDGKVKPYVGAHLGLALLRAKVTTEDPFFGNNSISDVELGFGVGFQSGVTIGVGDKIDLDAGIDIQGLFESGSGGYFGLRFGVNWLPMGN